MRQVPPGYFSAIAMKIIIASLVSSLVAGAAAVDTVGVCLSLAYADG